MRGSLDQRVQFNWNYKPASSVMVKGGNARPCSPSYNGIPCEFGAPVTGVGVYRQAYSNLTGWLSVPRGTCSLRILRTSACGESMRLQESSLQSEETALGVSAGMAAWQPARALISPADWRLIPPATYSWAMSSTFACARCTRTVALSVPSPAMVPGHSVEATALRTSQVWTIRPDWHWMLMAMAAQPPARA